MLSAAITLGSLALVSADPTPNWPQAFTAQVYEYTGFQENATKAQYIYDIANKRETFNRENGIANGACGPQSIGKPCNRIYVDGFRYRVLPTLQSCCMECTGAEGCGPVYPDWIQKNNGTYMGQVQVDGYMADKWLIQGNDANYFYQRAEDGTPLQLVQGDNVWQFEHIDNSVDPSDFDLPKYCDPKNTC